MFTNSLSVPSEENPALDSIALLESFSGVIEALKTVEVQSTSPSLKTILLNQIDLLETIYSVLDSQTAPIKLFGTLQIPRSKIEVLGVGGEVVRMRNKGATIEEIADKLDLTVSSVSSYLKRLQQLRPSEQAAVAAKNVYDFEARIQELYTTLQMNFNRLVGVDEGTAQKYVAELKSVITLAMTLTEKQQAYAKRQNFQAAVCRILQNELPHQRARILELIQAFQLEFEFNDNVAVSQNLGVNLPNASSTMLENEEELDD